MATIKFLNAAGKYDDPAAREDVIRYITQKVKTPSGYIGACGVDVPYAAQQMQEVSASFKKDNNVRSFLRHYADMAVWLHMFKWPLSPGQIIAMSCTYLSNQFI